MTEANADAARAVADLTFAQASAELDRIIDELDRGSLDLDLVGARLERATEIAEELARRLDANQRRIDELAPRLARLAGDDSADDEDLEDEG